MAAKKKRSGAQKTKTENFELRVALGVLVVILMIASIFFQAQTGFLGAYVGSGFFAAFGIMAYAFAPLVMVLLLCLLFDKLHGKLGKNIAFLWGLFICISLVLSIYSSARGSFATSMAIAVEKGMRHIGAGIFGEALYYGVSRLIGNVGIYLMTVLVILFFILHLMDMRLSDFIKRTVIRIKGTADQARDRASHHIRAQRQRSREAKQLRRTETAERYRTECERLDEDATADRAEVQKSASDALRISGYAEDIQSTAPAEAPVSEREPDAEPIIRAYTPAEISAEAVQASTPAPSVEKAAEIFDRKNRQRAIDVPEHVAINPEHDQMTLEKLGFEFEQEDEPVYQFPPIELLRLPERTASDNKTLLMDNARTIERTLESFGIEAKVVGIDEGPTVTCYELKPQSGVKVSRITNLADDLSLALAAEDIRIEAPIPGKPFVGIEVPNREKKSVLLREIIQSDPCEAADDSIPVGLGQSINGKPVVASIAKMPHVLIAGATGAGKSVCINTIIVSILYKYSPKEVRLILIDPKVVELSVYGEIPHLLIPVVTDAKKASKALYMAVQEMERRFKLFSEHSVRDIKGYREKAELDDNLENLPYIVVIIDELSDLMMVASKDVEAHITRLAQMARACGIHLIIATQRPSVDVITGTIKANIPSRISFQVSSAIDSRTILDMSGAEKLLGKGDMLYYPSTFSKPKRVQGAFISDGEVSNIVAYIKERHDARYDRHLMDSIERAAEAPSGDGADDENRDALMDEVIEFISHEETTSISGLQRRFRIGYARAGRIIDDLERMGYISAQEGSKPREVLIDEGFEPQGVEHEFTE